MPASWPYPQCFAEPVSSRRSDPSLRKIGELVQEAGVWVVEGAVGGGEMDRCVCHR